MTPIPTTRTGVLLINLGTPDSPRVPDVRRYLREFLSDARVLDMNPVGRWFLLNFIILPFRPAASAAAYQSIWGSEGSPLLVHGLALQRAVSEALGDSFVVELAMRYQNPSIARALARLRDADVQKILVLPLFPQYSSAATGSAIEKTCEIASRAWNVPELHFIRDFYEDEGFIGAFVDLARPLIEKIDAEHVLFSYHGLPERHVTKSDPSGAHCLARPDCCEAIVSANRHCYRAQCFATTRALARALALTGDRHSVSFQSRLGRIPWIRPYTDEVLPDLAKKGVKRLVVLSPAFVADCLETVEEIGIRGREQWMSLGGEAFELVPSLNAERSWVQAVCRLIERRV